MEFNEKRETILKVINYAENAGRKEEWPQEILAYRKLADEKEPLHRTAGGFPYTVNIFSARKQMENAPLFIYIHGGGWLKGHMDNDYSYAAYMADRINGTVFDFDYTTTNLAGEKVMMEQSLDISRYAYEHAADYGCDSNRISIGGFSSGGQLTVSTILRFIQAGEMPFALQIPGYAPLDLRSGSINPNENKRFADSLNGIEELVFEGDFSLQYDPVYSPLLAGNDLLEKCPQTLVISAARCPFRNQDHDFTRRLAENGVTVTEKCYKNSGHGFVPHFREEWKEASDLMAFYIKNAKRSER